MPKRFLILGGAGYLGARLAQSLSKTGEVTVTSRKLSPEKISWAKAAGVELRAFDSKSGNLNASGTFDAVVNLASPSSGEAGKDPKGALLGALASLETAIGLVEKGQAANLIHVSSFHVYGFHGQTRYRETDVPEPTSPYGASHLACEQRLKDWLAQGRVAIVRPTNIVGAPAHAELGPQAGLLFLDCCRQAASLGEIRLNNDGSAQRDFIPFPDAISALERLLTQPVSGLFNLASGKSQTLRAFSERLCAAAARHLGHEVKVFFGAARDPFDRPFEVTTSALSSTGWRPAGDFDREIESTVEFFRRASDPKRNRA